MVVNATDEANDISPLIRADKKTIFRDSESKKGHEAIEILIISPVPNKI